MSHRTTLQKVGTAIFAIGAVYMFGLGALYSWRVVPAANQIGQEAFSGMLGILWVMSVPLGAFMVAMGGALSAGVDRRRLWLLAILMVLFAIWQFTGTTQRLISPLFGVGGGLITLFFLGSTWHWAKTRPTLAEGGQTGSDLRMLGSVFFLAATWNLCGIFGMWNYVLRPELADKFAVPISRTINSASTVMVLLFLGWGFTFLGSWSSQRARETRLETGRGMALATAKSG